MECIRNSQTTTACAASKYKPLPFSWIPWPEQGQCPFLLSWSTFTCLLISLSVGILFNDLRIVHANPRFTLEWIYLFLIALGMFTGKTNCSWWIWTRSILLQIMMYSVVMERRMLCLFLTFYCSSSHFIVLKVHLLYCQVQTTRGEKTPPPVNSAAKAKRWLWIRSKTIRKFWLQAVLEADT
jgi:hypothetical protein